MTDPLTRTLWFEHPHLFIHPLVHSSTSLKQTPARLHYFTHAFPHNSSTHSLTTISRRNTFQNHPRFTCLVSPVSPAINQRPRLLQLRDDHWLAWLVADYRPGWEVIQGTTPHLCEEGWSLWQNDYTLLCIKSYDFVRFYLLLLSGYTCGAAELLRL